MKIKVCGMRDPQNIAGIAALEPDYMGFIFYERSPRCAAGLSPDALKILPPTTKRVGVFVDAPEEIIRSAATLYGLDYIQLHGSESPELCRRLRGEYGVIKAFGICGSDDLAKTTAYEGTCDHYVFDTKTPAYGGSGRKFDHTLLSGYTGETPYLLSGGLGPDDGSMLASCDAPLCIGFDINSRFETAPGMKDQTLIKNFIETIKNRHR